MSRDDERVLGRLTRTFKTALLGGRVGSSYLGGKIADAFRKRGARGDAAAVWHVANAQKIVETMAHLRGPLMKVGQLLSTHAEALPEEYRGILESLQSSAPPMSFETIRAVLEEDLGELIQDLFEDLTHEVVAVASLGQVHWARFRDGTDVVVKV